MATISEWVKIESETLSTSLKQAHQKVSLAQGDVVLDLSSLLRLDTETLLGLEELLSFADEKQVKLAMRGVTIDVYKVLKLSRLSSRFAFVG
jgi:ABC-type transporter Mla MlaB component